MPVTLATVKTKLVYDEKKKKGIKNHANAELIDEFDSFMQTNDNSESYRKNNLKAIINFAEWLQAKYPRMTFTEVRDKEKYILPFLESKRKSKKDDPEEKWITTYNDYLARLKFFFRWLHNVRLNKKGKDALNIEDWQTPPFVQIKKKRTKRESPYSLSEIWENPDDIRLIIEYEPDPRNKATIPMLWDMDGRNHELMLVKNKNVRFRERYAEGEVPHQAKTGSGPFRLVVSFTYARDWYNQHPLKDDPDAPFICSMKKGSIGEPLSSDYLWKITNNLKERIKELLRDGAIKDQKKRERLEHLLKTKKWNPYCFRHSAISYDSDILPEFALRQKVRWSMNSKQPSRYIKRRFSKTVENTILNHYGITNNDEAAKPKPININCSRCQYVNAIQNKICSSCGYPLSESAYAEIKAEERNAQETIRSMQERLKALENERENMTEEIMKRLQEKENRQRAVLQLRGKEAITFIDALIENPTVPKEALESPSLSVYNMKQVMKELMEEKLGSKAQA